MNIALRRIHVISVAMEKQNTYCILNESLALCITQCACAILSSAACLAEPYFSTSSHKMVRFLRKKKIIEHKMCVLNLSTTLASNIFHSKRSAARYYHKWR